MKPINILQELESRGFHRIRPSLTQVHKILSVLGSPHNAVPVIHVAGTNGKGSVCATLESVMRHAGYRTGFYSSPHLCDITERIRIAGRPISKSDFIEIARELHEVEIEKSVSLTYFEFTTAMAYMAFARARCDVAIMECGMGGKWDATNVVSQPLMAIITSIGLDHTAWLGGTEKRIAIQKAGIIKGGHPTISGVRGPGRSVIRQVAMKRQSPLSQIDLDFDGKGKSTLWTESRMLIQYDEHSHRDEYVFGLVGQHQVDNAAVSLAAIQRLREMGWHIEERDVRGGLREVRWPGRLQRFVRNGVSILLDGAHNPDAIQRLTATLHESEYSRRRIHLVYSAFKDKDAAKMAKTLAPLAHRVYLTPMPDERGMSAKQLMHVFKRVHKRCAQFPTPKAAIASACKAAGKQGVVLVTGSLRLIGIALDTLSRNEGDKQHV